VELDEHGDPGTPYTRFAVVDTLQDQYRERLIYSTASWWITDVVGTIVPSPTSRTTVEQSVVVGGGRSSSSGSSTRSRTQAVGNDNALQTSFYTSDGVLTHSRLISFRSDAGGPSRRIVSTQSFADGFEPTGLIECVDFKLASRAAADAALGAAGLPATPGVELVAPTESTGQFSVAPAPCNVSSVELADFPQWADEHGFWVGDLTYFGADLQPNYAPDRWNYPYDHYRGFITGSVDGGSYSQRNTFFYPPQTAERCALSNGTYVEGEACGSSGALRTFQADQTTEVCDANEGGRISGPYGEDSTTTTLIDDHAVLYQIWSANADGVQVFYQSQMTTITHSADGQQVRRTRTAQFFDRDTGVPSWFSFYRELKVAETTFWTRFNQTVDEYGVTDTALQKRCHGGYANLRQFMLGSMDWDGDKYSCPIPMDDDAAQAQRAVWTAVGVSGWATYYPNDPMAAGAFITASQLAQVPGATVASLAGFGWVEILATPNAMWTAVGVSGWATYYPNDPMAAGAFITASQLAQVPGATVASLAGFGWVETLA